MKTGQTSTTLATAVGPTRAGLIAMKRVLYLGKEKIRSFVTKFR